MGRRPTETFTLVSLGRFGERARPLRAPLRQAVLVIGLGQVGLRAVARVHAMFERLLPQRERQANVRLLALARRRSLREEAMLPREERLLLEMDALPWTDVPGRYSHLGVPRWWPHSPRSREVLNEPHLVRAYNRLLLFDNAALVGETLYKLTQWLHSVGVGRKQEWDRRIYVLASLAEAEGSGMLFDVASRLRALCGTHPTTIMGVFTLRAPHPNDPEHVLEMANVYATLREIDAYTLQPHIFRSTLPVTGYSLPAAPPRPALDMIFLTDDAAHPLPEPPEHALAECVTTWVAAALQEQTEGTLPEPIEHPSGTDHFRGYSTFGVSKVALPVRAAMDLAAVGLARAVLRALKGMRVSMPFAQWAEELARRAYEAITDEELLLSPSVAERLRQWAYDLSAAALTRRLEKQDVSLSTLVRNEWARLTQETEAAPPPTLGTVTTVPDTLRVRVDNALEERLAEVRETVLNSSVELAYAQGYGLVWTISALEALAKHLDKLLPRLEWEEDEADAAYHLAHNALLETAAQYDARSGGRFGGGAKRALLAEFNTHAETVLDVVARRIAIQARLAAWRALRELIDGLIVQMREVMPLIERTEQSLSAFETACRRAMEGATNQPPQFPAAVVLTEAWYVQGVQGIAEVGKLPPQELLRRVFAAWGRENLSPERRLRRFVQEVLDAARRALSGLFTFQDLYEFLNAHGQMPAFRQVTATLPGAASPAMIPTVDEAHPAPARYEIVREEPRPFSFLSASQPNVIRAFVHSPDPDEITVIRVLHGIMAEALPALREGYRRSYERARAEGMPLHIDRRWDATMADLVHTSARKEISQIWEQTLAALRQNPHAAQKPLEALIRAFGVALDVQETLLPQNTPTDMRLAVYKLRPFRLKLPPPHCAVLFLYSHRSAEEVGRDVLHAISPLPLEEQFAFVVNITGRPDIDKVLEPLRHVDFTVLVLDEADVKHLIGAQRPTRALGDLVLDQVHLTTVSPFYTRGPVPEHMFFGREREINEVRSKLRTHSVALIGGRRIGKTSTLQRIQRLLAAADSEYAPYYLDCHGATTYRSFFWLINRRWNVNIPQDADPVQFELVVEELQKRHTGKSVVFLFDEVDSLLLFDRRPERQETLFRTFRSLSNEKRCQYVFSGEKWLMHAIGDPYSALFNFTQAVRLAPLPPKVVHRLVAEPFEMLNVWIEQSEQVINRIYQISAGHPNIVQMICQAMVEELDQDAQNAGLLNIEHLDRATSRRTLQEEIVQTIWGQMTPLARLVTLIWPEGERFLTLAQIEEMLHTEGVGAITPERLERTAKDLELYCFVRPREHDRLELIPMAFPAILDFMTDRKRQIELMRRQYEADPQGVV